MASVFTHTIRIRFGQTDMGGIVYFPNFFDMFNTVLHEWFEHLGFDYGEMLLKRHLGTPSVHAECDFFVPSRVGDDVEFTILLDEVGRSSMKFTIHAHVGPQERLRAKLVYVLMDLKTAKSTAIPDDLRTKFDAYRLACQGWSLAQ